MTIDPEKDTFKGFAVASLKSSASTTISYGKCSTERHAVEVLICLVYKLLNNSILNKNMHLFTFKVTCTYTYNLLIEWNLYLSYETNKYLFYSCLTLRNIQILRNSMIKQ